MATHEKVYTCKKCNIPFENYNDLKAHTSSEHQQKKT